MSNREPIQDYIKVLRKNLILPRRSKKDFLDGMTQELNDFKAEHPNSTIRDLESVFGAPVEVARNFIDDSGLSELMIRHKKRRLIIGIGIAILVVIIICLGFWIFSMLSYTQVRVTQTISEQSAVIVSDNN